MSEILKLLKISICLYVHIIYIWSGLYEAVLLTIENIYVCFVFLNVYY